MSMPATPRWWSRSMIPLARSWRNPRGPRDRRQHPHHLHQRQRRPRSNQRRADRERSRSAAGRATPTRAVSGFLSWSAGPALPFPQAKTSDVPVCSIDLFPTIAAATGTKLPEKTIIDGLNLLPHLKEGLLLERDELIWHFPHYRHAPGPYSIIRRGDLKLIKYWTGTHELYDLKNDLSEKTNLATQKPDLVKELDTLLLQRLKESDAKFPKPNPDFVKK